MEASTKVLKCILKSSNIYGQKFMIKDFSNDQLNFKIGVSDFTGLAECENM